MNKVGDRVRLVSHTDIFTQLMPGAEGTVDFIDSMGTVFVKWDDGHSLGLIAGTDRWETISQ